MYSMMSDVMEQPRTLIADDQPHVVEALRLLLKNEGIQTETAQSPAAVIDKLRSRRFDLVLMDLNYTRDTTSGEEGLDLLERIQSIDRTLPVVAMTAWATVDLAVEAMRRGVCDFVLKPWENSRLVGTLRNQIQKGRDRRSQIRREREEADEARAMGRALLPRAIPQFSGIEIATASRPAGALSGDYFDVLDLGDGKAGLAIADVIGKGVAAAILMSNVQAAVRALASPDPASLAARVNASVMASSVPGKFVTFFYGVLDSETGVLRYTNAGHSRPLVVRANGDTEWLADSGAVLGVFPDWRYESSEVRLAKGDRLILFTDGLTEAQNWNNEEFGEDRLAGLAGGISRLSAAEIKDGVLAGVDGFTGGSLQDDATLVVLAT